jgi:hypothetical protein
MPASRFTKKANTPKKRRQWSDVEQSALKRGASAGSAVKQANAVVRDHPAKGR